MNEIDRFLKGAAYDPLHTRGSRIDEVALSNEKKYDLFTRRVARLLVLVFNEDRPYYRLSRICGMTEEYWSRQLSQPRIHRRAAIMLMDGLRAHMLGIRDHIAECDDEVRALTQQAIEPHVWEGRKVATRKRRLRG